MLGGGIFLISQGGFNLGVDFKAGSDISLVTKQKITKKQIKEDMKELKLKETEITINQENIDIMISNVLNANQVKKVKNHFTDKYTAKVDIGVVSNVVKEQLINNAIAAVLAIIGYSINDTIVCFDRIRENLDKINDKKLTKEKLEEVTNQSIRETFTRTIWTSLTTIIPVLTLIFLGSREILEFNIAMLIGLISGTYSSIFIATTIFLLVEKKNIGKKKKIKKVYKDDLEEKMIKGVNC